MVNRMTSLSRIVAAVGGLLLPVVLLLPIWRIELTAPQYPEGLVLQIHAHKLGGDVDVVNGLNHYIGMRTLHEKDFVEFQVLPYIIGLLGLFGLLAVVINRKWFFYVWVGFFLLFAATAMIDFYRWNYNYGHNLDPSAPIQVPGMSYQPPLIGYKQLLNFGAYSIPDWGGWIFVAVGIALVAAAIYELRSSRKPVSHYNIPVLAGACIVATLLITGCSNGPVPIRFGKDACAYCKMTVMDNRYGGELVTKTGKVYKFDDVACITAHIKENSLSGDVYLVDFSGSGKLVPARSGWLLESDAVRAPMGSNVAAFASEDSFRVCRQQLNGRQITWDELLK